MKIAIIGHGGHSRVIQDMVWEKSGCEIIGYFDDKYQSEFYDKGLFFGPLNTVLKLGDHFDDLKYLIAIGNNQIRKAISEKFDFPVESYATLIHSSATISRSAVIGNGTVVMPGVVINVDSCVGNHSIINTNAVIEHDNQVGSFVHISPNATLTGGVNVGDGAHIGAGASVIPSKKVGEWAVIGAGGVVIEDIPPFNTAVGVPAKCITKSVSGGI